MIFLYITLAFYSLLLALLYYWFYHADVNSTGING